MNSSFPDSRVRLRQARDDDLAFLRGLRNDVEAQRAAMAVARGGGLEEVRAWIERRRVDPAALLMVVAEADSDRPVGYAQLTGIVREQQRAWLGICIDRRYQRRGLGAAAVALLERHAREALGLRKILLEVLESNAAARALYARAGYREVGRLLQHFRMPDSDPEDAVLMEKLL